MYEFSFPSSPRVCFSLGAFPMNVHLKHKMTSVDPWGGEVQQLHFPNEKTKAQSQGYRLPLVLGSARYRAANRMQVLWPSSNALSTPVDFQTPQSAGEEREAQQERWHPKVTQPVPGTGTWPLQLNMLFSVHHRVFLSEVLLNRDTYKTLNAWWVMKHAGGS